MSLTFSEALDTVRAARETINNADFVVRGALPLIVGRLRAAECFEDDLRALKKELQDFNAVSGKWKEKK